MVQLVGESDNYWWLCCTGRDLGLHLMAQDRFLGRTSDEPGWPTTSTNSNFDWIKVKIEWMDG